MSSDAPSFDLAPRAKGDGDWRKNRKILRRFFHLFVSKERERKYDKRQNATWRPQQAETAELLGRVPNVEGT